MPIIKILKNVPTYKEIGSCADVENAEFDTYEEVAYESAGTGYGFVAQPKPHDKEYFDGEYLVVEKAWPLQDFYERRIYRLLPPPLSEENNPHL